MLRITFVTLLMTLASFFQPTPALAQRAAYIPLRGANLTEQQIQWAWMQMPAFLGACALTKECGLTGEQRVLAHLIYANTSHYSPDSLVFANEADQGGFKSQIGETERVALTGFTPDAKIYINRDRLAQQPLSFWFGIFAHEAAHHLGIKDDANRIPDQLGSAIMQAVEAHLVRAQYPENQDGVIGIYLNPPMPTIRQTLIDFPNGVFFHGMLMDKHQAYDDNDSRNILRAADFCPDSVFISIRIDAERLAVHPDPAHPGKLQASATFNADVACWNREGTSGFRQGKNLFYSLELDQRADGLTLNTEIYGGWAQVGSESGAGSFDHGTVLELNAPTSVAAGSTLVVKAKVRAPKAQSYPGCEMWLTSTAWPKLDSADSFDVISDKCELTQITSDTFEMTASRYIPEGATPITLILEHLCLSTNDPKAPCIPADPAKQATFKIINSKQSLKPEISDVRLDGVRPASIGRDKAMKEYDDTFEFAFRVRNATGLQHALVSVYVDDGTPEGGMQYNLPITVTSDMAPEFHQSQVGSDTLASARLRILPMGNFKPRAFRIEGLIYGTNELFGGYVDLTPLKLLLYASKPGSVK